MQDRTGLDERLDLRWRDDELRGTIPRRGSLPADSFVDTAMGLFAVFVAGVAVPLAMTKLMISSGIAGWPFPALVAAVVTVGVGVMVTSLLAQAAVFGVQAWFGVSPWQFVLTETHLVWSGAEASRKWEVAHGFRPAFGWSFGPRRLLLSLTEVEAIDVAPPGLQIELLNGDTLYLDVDPEVTPTDLDAICTFVMERADRARSHAEGRRATTHEALRALAPLRERERR